MKLRLIKQMSLVFLILISQCGIPSNETYEDLNSPKNLTIVSIVSGQIQISFTAYNPEVNFSGYEVYMDLTSETNLRTQHNLHIVDNEINTTIETNYITKSQFTLGYPTIQSGDPDGNNVDAARSSAVTVTYTIKFAPNQQPIGGGKWYIGVSAFSSTTHIESALSNVVQVP